MIEERGEQGPVEGLNRSIISALELCEEALSKKGKSSLCVGNEEVKLIIGENQLAKITPSDILVLGESFQDKLQPKMGEESGIKDLRKFMEELSPSLVRLNHLGISYFVEDLDREIERLKKMSDKNGVALYEEPSPNPNQKWFFAGNKNNWQDPLFEFVLNRGYYSETDEWVPHFQIDLDTSMTAGQIEKIADHYQKGFIKWKLNIPNFGEVLAMGIIGRVGDVKIALGLGTNIRGTEFHRTQELKPV